MLYLSRCCSEFSVGSFSLEAEQEPLHSLWHVVPGEKARTPHRHAYRIDVCAPASLRSPVQGLRSFLDSADLRAHRDGISDAHARRHR